MLRTNTLKALTIEDYTLENKDGNLDIGRQQPTEIKMGQILTICSSTARISA